MNASRIFHDRDQDRIPGYDYGRADAAGSPVSLDELRQIEETVGWRQEDADVLRRHVGMIGSRAEQMVDSWRAVIGSQPHLVKWFFAPDGKRDERYAAQVKKRFVQWVVDVCTRAHDQDWLNYQEEIGLRHLPAKKNQTDAAQTPPLVPLRFLIGFVPVVTLSVRDIFAESGVVGRELQLLQDAWTKAVQIHIVLWTRPYTVESLW